MSTRQVLQGNCILFSIVLIFVYCAVFSSLGYCFWFEGWLFSWLWMVTIFKIGLSVISWLLTYPSHVLSLRKWVGFNTRFHSLRKIIDHFKNCHCLWTLLCCMNFGRYINREIMKALTMRNFGKELINSFAYYLDILISQNILKDLSEMFNI